MKIEWTGTGLNEKGIDENGNVIVEVNKRYFRNTEVDTLLGDANKAKKKLGWECKINFNELVSEMTNFDLNLAKKENS